MEQDKSVELTSCIYIFGYVREQQWMAQVTPHLWDERQSLNKASVLTFILMIDSPCLHISLQNDAFSKASIIPEQNPL